MSVEHLAAVLYHSRSSGTARLVAIGIANHQGEAGAWPSIARLARLANADERSVRRAINELIELGELSVERNAGGMAETDVRYRTNRYSIEISCPPGCDRSTNHRVVDNSAREDNMSSLDRGQGGQSIPSREDRMSAKPSVEPSTPTTVCGDTHDAGDLTPAGIYERILDLAAEKALEQAVASGATIGNRLRYRQTVRERVAPILTEKLPRWLELFDAPLDLLAAVLLEPDLSRQLALYERGGAA